MGKKGFTLQEVLVGIALASVITLLLAQTISYLTQSQLRSQAQADLQNDAIRIIQKFTVVMGKAGDGVPNSSTIGKSIFATTGMVDSSSITFFSRDIDLSGTMTPGDEWTRYRLAGGNIYEEKFLTNAWTNIAAGSVLPSSQNIIPLSANAWVSVLQFNFYSSGSKDNASADPNDPPQEIMDAHAASWVRVHIELQKSGATVSKDAWIELKNVLFARQT